MSEFKEVTAHELSVGDVVLWNDETRTVEKWSLIAEGEHFAGEVDMTLSGWGSSIFDGELFKIKCIKNTSTEDRYITILEAMLTDEQVYLAKSINNAL